MVPICSRNCRFCNISGGSPEPLDPDEPKNVAEVASELGLSHVVVTSVSRDDLPDEGANQFRRTILEIHKRLPKATVEVLTPDFHARQELLDLVLKANPTVFNHNVETVPRLYSKARPQADYRCSLDVLAYAAQNYRQIKTKSGVMVGLGETMDELAEIFKDLGSIGVNILTIGQYLAPTGNHNPIEKYYTPEEFKELEKMAHDGGVPIVVSGPLVRSSYKAGSILT